MEHAASDAGIKLEYVNGLPVWEALPVYRHQKKTLDIQVSILKHSEGSGCACIPVADTTIIFPDGSYKRPDIAVFCEEPVEQDKATTSLPQAVIEIISKGYEKKDLEVSLPFYLAQNIRDIVMFDPALNRVSHYHDDKVDEFDSPVELAFACGCRVTV
jgi:Uma2 family endonuclease